ncbi:MAG TPA: RPA12/RPB9/RPC11 RNA polymerase family protein [Candidatus Thermoplasmatota archaeon]|nr:RPA12/RPB9/RPC11 RNA polymerase family protein [Candidatus Thermoplasmatota archaeon]
MICPKCRTMGRPSPGRGFLCGKCGNRWKPDTPMIVRGSEQRRIDKLDDLGVIDDPSKFEMQIWPIDQTIRCGQCGTWGAYYYQRQTRKSDEPPTTFYQCTGCKKKWKRSK